MLRRYLVLWVKTAFWHAPGIIDLISGLSSALLRFGAHFLQGGEQVVNAADWQIVGWAAAGIIGLRIALAPYWIWKEDQKKIDDLTEKITPKLDVVFSENIEGCVVDTNFNVKNGARVRYWRLKVINLSSSIALLNCRGELTDMWRVDDLPEEEWDFSGHEIPLTWTLKNKEGHKIEENINGGRHLFLDVVHAWNSKASMCTEISLISIDDILKFKNKGTYMLEIMISAINSSPIKKYVTFKWTGDWQTAEMEECHEVDF